MRRRPGSQWTPGVTERSDMRDQLIAHVIGDGRGTRRSCPGYLVTCCWGGRQSSSCGRAGRTPPRSPVPGRLVLVNPHPSSASCDTSRSPAPITPAAEGGTASSAGPSSGAATTAAATAPPHRRPGRSLLRRWLAARARAHPGPEGPALRGQRPPMPARALSAQVQLAHPVDPVRRAGRGSARITRLVHLPPPSGPPGPGARPAAPHRLLASSHLLSRLGRLAAMGTTARSGAPSGMR